MFPRYGKQITVRSEWFNLPPYTAMSPVAFKLWVRINQLADKYGWVDLDHEELAIRINLLSADIPSMLREIGACKLIRTYEDEGALYAVIEGYTSPGHINRQVPHKKSPSNWHNPKPPWIEKMPDEVIVNASFHEAPEAQRPQRGRDAVPASQGDGDAREVGVAGRGSSRADLHPSHEPSDRGLPRRRQGHAPREPKSKPKPRTSFKATEKPREAGKVVAPNPTRSQMFRGGRFDLKAWRAEAAAKQKRDAAREKKTQGDFKEFALQVPLIGKSVTEWMGKLSAAALAGEEEWNEVARQAYEMHPRAAKFRDIQEGLMTYQRWIQERGED